MFLLKRCLKVNTATTDIRNARASCEFIKLFNEMQNAAIIHDNLFYITLISITFKLNIIGFIK